MSFARNPKTGKLYFFQLHENSSEWLAYPETGGIYSLRWSTESRTWVPKEGIDLEDWSLDCPKAITNQQFKSGKGACKVLGKFFINIHAVLT
jgi:hypothetical protein